MVGNLLLRGMLVGVIAGLLGILRLKSALRLEWRSQDAQHKDDQCYHAARIADSLTPPTRTRFSAHIGQCAILHKRTNAPDFRNRLNLTLYGLRRCSNKARH